MASMLASSFTRLSVRPQALSSRNNGMSAAVAVAAPRPTMRVAAVTAQPIVAGKNKCKTRKAASKRYKVTGNGKVVARHCGLQHKNEHMGKDRKKRLSKDMVCDSRDVKNNVRRCMPYSKIK